MVIFGSVLFSCIVLQEVNSELKCQMHSVNLDL